MAQGGFSAHLVTVIVDGIIVTGFADGDFVSADHDSDDTAAFEGADGYVATADKPAERLGTVEIKLMQTSLANTTLAKLMATKTFVRVQIYNAKGGELALMSRGKLKKAPAIAYGKDVKERTWTFIGKLRKSIAGFEE